MKKIGILGGTFDPIHVGHLIAAEQALYHEKLDEIWFMPAPKPPHKADKNITPIEDRINMINRAIESETKFKLCSIELKRNGTSYTIDTIKELKNKYTDDKFYFIVGGDMIKYLPKWRGISELLKLVKFIGMKRPGYEYKAITEMEKIILDNIIFIPMPQLEISSSQIREWIKEDKPIHYIVPTEVEQYIKENKLYGS